ncbi:MAG: hypothetical protein HQL38_08415 [Alphaproteobacteria bacterium]|nr:hypothetical protein [Alphaproteobacteria bacterium]
MVDEVTFSEPMTIGKHEWRIRFDEGGTINYEWRRLGQRMWRSYRDWPSYDFNNGQTAGLPASVKKLWERERKRVDLHTGRISPVQQLSLFAAIPGELQLAGVAPC